MNRRRFLGVSAGGIFGLLSRRLLSPARARETPDPHAEMITTPAPGPINVSGLLTGRVDPASNGFDPMQMLVDWDTGTLTGETTVDGRPVRQWEISARDIEIQVAPGISLPAWSYNARVPGPSLRCLEGDHLRVTFANDGARSHTMHFHNFHPAEMDGIEGEYRGGIEPGEQFTYEFDADPFGCHLYRCRAMPRRHNVQKGMYGSFVIDPAVGRPPAREFMMVMNAFDTDFDGRNDIYAINTVGHEFVRRPIPVQTGELIRIYLINVAEFDLVNSFRLHANFFDYYDTGTTLTPTLRLVDTVVQARGQRGILELRFRWPGRYMFRAHADEVAELGWMGFFNAVQPADFNAALTDAGLDAEWDFKSLNSSTALQPHSR